MATVRVLDGGSWKTIEAPYIMHDDAWETVFKVHVLNGGVWKESHKTAYTKYSDGTGGQAETQSDGSWTVPAKTRYIKVKIWGNGASAGGGITTSKYNPTGGGSVTQTRAVGGSGGHGAYLEAILETKPGVTFSWTGFSSTPYLTAGRGSQSLQSAGITAHVYNDINGAKYPDLPTSHSMGAMSVHTASYNEAYGAFHGEVGNDAPDIVFTGDSLVTDDPYILTAGGGKKGYGGIVWITASSKSGNTHYYTLSSASGHAFASGSSYPGPLDDGITGYDFTNTDQTNAGWSDGRGSMNAGSATATGNGSSFISTTLTEGAGAEGGWYGLTPLESDGAGSSVYNGKDGSIGTKGKLIIETYQ